MVRCPVNAARPTSLVLCTRSRQSRPSPKGAEWWSQSHNRARLSGARPYRRTTSEKLVKQTRASSQLKWSR